jgi:hypothetical protein
VESNQRDFGNGFIGELVLETKIDKDIPLGADFIPPRGFEYAVDTNQYNTFGPHFQQTFPELGEHDGFHILVDKVVHLEPFIKDGVNLVALLVERKLFKVDLPKQEVVGDADTNVVQFKPRSV